MAVNGGRRMTTVASEEGTEEVVHHGRTTGSGSQTGRSGW